MSRPEGQKTVAVTGATGHVKVVGTESSQYLTARVSADFGAETPCPPRDLELEVLLDGERYPATRDCLYDYQIPTRGGRVGFRLPHDITPGEGAIRWLEQGTPVASWTLPAKTLSALASPPEFTVRSVDAPERVEAGDLVVLSFVVENAGGAGTFRYAVDDPSQTSPAYETTTVDAGERTRILYSFDATAVSGSATDTITVSVDYGTGTVRRTIELT